MRVSAAVPCAPANPTKEISVKTSIAVVASIPLVSLCLAALPLLAMDPAPEVSVDMTFVEMAKSSPDGKIEKSKVMGAIERKFDTADTRKERKLDEWQAKQFQEFLKNFTRESGA
jgi:hypothetical protein